MNSLTPKQLAATRRSKNRLLLTILGGLCVIFYGLALVKFQHLPQNFYALARAAQQQQ
ncbi:MAG: hypothetical protein ABFQ95_03765 [Pseudomonadota bacterium]